MLEMTDAVLLPCIHFSPCTIHQAHGPIKCRMKLTGVGAAVGLGVGTCKQRTNTCCTQSLRLLQAVYYVMGNSGVA